MCPLQEIAHRRTHLRLPNAFKHIRNAPVPDGPDGYYVRPPRLRGRDVGIHDDKLRRIERSLSNEFRYAEDVSGAAIDAARVYALAYAPDSPLVITGRLDGENRSFSAFVRLTYTGEDATKLVFLPSDLRDRCANACG